MKHLLLLALLTLTACGPKVVPRAAVIPHADGDYVTIAKNAREDAALKWALSTAEATCADQGQRFVVVDQTTSYNGLFDERFSRVAGVVGGIAARAGNLIPTGRTPEDYECRLTFRCQ